MKHAACMLVLVCMAFFGGSMAHATQSAALTPRQAAIIPIAAFTANGDTERLGQALTAGLENGLAVNDIKEIIVQMYAYTGFPRSLTGMGTFMNVLKERQAKGIKDQSGSEPREIPANADRRALGARIQTELVGRPVAGPIYEFAPVMDTFLKEHLFCDIFARDVLTNQERELATVAALAALPAPAQLASHLNVCRNVGLTEPQLRDYVKIMAEKVGHKEGALANEKVTAMYAQMPR